MQPLSIAVFCGSRSGNDPSYLKIAESIGRIMGQRGNQLVYGGSSRGIMGALADSVLKNGGTAVGVLPEFLASVELAHPGLSDLIYVKTLHERKQVMADMAHGFLALPGGIGTLDELVEILSWRMLSLHKKPVYLYNESNFFDHLLELLGVMKTSGFLKEGFEDAFKVIQSTAEFNESLDNINLFNT